MPKSWVENEFEKMGKDFELSKYKGHDLYHSTKSYSKIIKSKRILPLKFLNKKMSCFGQSNLGVADASEYVSLTWSIERGKRYLEVLVAIAGLINEKITIAQWVNWYLSRWGEPLGLLQKISNNECQAINDFLFTYGLNHIGQSPNEIGREIINYLKDQSPIEQFKIIIKIDEQMMRDYNPDNGLGIINPDFQEWANVKLSEVALFKVKLSKGYFGHDHSDEEEVRIKGAVNDFEVVTKGQEVFDEMSWQVLKLDKN